MHVGVYLDCHVKSSVQKTLHFLYDMNEISKSVKSIQKSNLNQSIGQVSMSGVAAVFS